MKQMSPDFPALVYAAVLAELKHVDGIEVGIYPYRIRTSIGADIETIKALRCQNAKLKEMNVKLENICKGHVADKNKRKRKAVAASPPAQKRQKLHECGDCEGCSDENKARCAKEHRLKVWE